MAKSSTNKSKQDAMDTLLKAATHPTDEHVNAALNHPDLRAALEGLSREDFQAIAKVVAPYLSLKNTLLDPSQSNITSLTANNDLGQVVAKLSPEDFKAIGHIMKASAAASNCGNHVCPSA